MMRGDEGDEVKQGEFAGLVFVPMPCPHCGAKDEDEANVKCRPSSDQTGERHCVGEFNEAGISVQPTAESISAMDAWIDEQVAKDEADEAKCRERQKRRASNISHDVPLRRD